MTNHNEQANKNSTEIVKTMKSYFLKQKIYILDNILTLMNNDM